MSGASGGEAYIQGVSTRSVDELVKTLGMSGIAKTPSKTRRSSIRLPKARPSGGWRGVSRLCQEIDAAVPKAACRLGVGERVDAFLNRPLDGDGPCPWPPHAAGCMGTPAARRHPSRASRPREPAAQRPMSGDLGGEAYGHGVATRAVDDLVKAMGGTGVSKSPGSRRCVELDAAVQAFLTRPIEGQWPSLWIDATYLRSRKNGRIVSLATRVAVAVNSDGRRAVPGVATGPSMASRPFLRSLQETGPAGPGGRSGGLLDRVPALAGRSRPALRGLLAAPAAPIG